MTADLTPDLAELRRLAEAATPGPWVSGDPRFGLGNAQCIVSISERAMGRDIQGPTLRPAQFDVEYIAAANPAVVLALLDAAAFLDEVRGQVARGALCPMCSTGMTRQTVGMVCQLCGTDYARPEQTSLRRDRRLRQPHRRGGGAMSETDARPAETVAETVPTRTAPLNNLAAAIYGNARDHGFWDDGERNFAEMLMLVTSELAEALEEHREGRPNVYHSINARRVYRVVDASGADWTTNPNGLSLGNTYTGFRVKPEGVAVELADALIRILDTMHSLGVDIDAVVADKMAYNATRPFKHGKAY